MDTIRMLFNSFWFCLSIAVLNLYFLAVNLEAAETWEWSAIAVVTWTYLSWRTTRRDDEGIELTPNQRRDINVLSRKFKEDVEAIINEDTDDGSNRGADKKTDTKQPEDD